MPTIVVRLDPSRLSSPDADLRYAIPELLAARSGGLIADDGYDYEGEPPQLVLFLRTEDLDPALACVVNVIENVRVLENDLRHGSVVSIETEGQRQIVYPAA